LAWPGQGTHPRSRPTAGRQGALPDRGAEDNVLDVARIPEKALCGHLDADHGVSTGKLSLLAQPVKRALPGEVPRCGEGRHLLDPAAVGGPTVVLPAVLHHRGAHDLRDRSQARRLRERVLLAAQIAAEHRRARCRDRLQTLFGSQRDSPAVDAVKIDRGRVALALAKRCRSFSKQWQNSMLPHPSVVGAGGDHAPAVRRRPSNRPRGRRVSASQSRRELEVVARHEERRCGGRSETCCGQPAARPR
jgi:hypothetical protein